MGYETAIRDGLVNSEDRDVNGSHRAKRKTRNDAGPTYRVRHSRNQYISGPHFCAAQLVESAVADELESLIVKLSDADVLELDNANGSGCGHILRQYPIPICK